MATLIEEEFEEFVNTKLSEHEQEYATEKHIQLQAIPQFISLIKETNILSSKKSNLFTTRIKWPLPSACKQQQEKER